MKNKGKFHLLKSGLILCLLILLIAECKKEEHNWVELKDSKHNSTAQDTTSIDTTVTVGGTDTTIIPPPPLVVLTDSIYCLDIDDTTLQSVFSYTPAWNCNRPSPSDSSAYYELDVTGDGVSDIKFQCSTSYSFTSASNPCANYSFVISCGINSVGGTVTLSNSMVEPLVYGDIIDAADLYRPGGSALKVIQPSFGFCWPTNTDRYIGLQIVRNGVTMYGWLLVNVGNGYNSVTIKSFAINKRNGFDVFAGQTN